MAMEEAMKQEAVTVLMSLLWRNQTRRQRTMLSIGARLSGNMTGISAS